MKLPELTEDILKIARGSNISKDETISRRQIWDWIHQYRALLIIQKINKGQDIDDSWIQRMNCLALEVKDRAECPSTLSTIESGCTILRTIQEVPPIIKVAHMDGLLFVGNIDGKPYQIISEQRIHFITHKPFSGRDTFAYVKGNYVYILNNLPLKYISLYGIFSDPTDLSTYINSCSSTVCYHVDTEDYPISYDIIPAIKEMIIKNEMGIQISSPSDKDNDAQNIVTPNITK